MTRGPTYIASRLRAWRNTSV